ncbi:hypothetical protein BFL35_04965 [Clavibacter michiganensis]|nr:hypothetical protein BFL35_04965 [Clavibacter michiganensis]
MGCMTDSQDREPTPLEQAIARGQAGESDMTAVLTEFINTVVVVPTATPLTPETDQLQPVLFDREGVPMLAAFTHEDRIDEKVTSVADHVATIPAAELVQAIPEGTGLVINVGTTDGFEMMPEGVAQLADDVRRVIDQDGDAPQAPAAPSPDAV